MLRITASKNSAGAAQYFSQNLERGDYYLPNDEKAVGYWYGSMAKRLGLFEGQEISKQSFVDLLNNRQPVAGEKLNPRNSVNRKCSYDFTWSVPKSVSLLVEFGEDKKVKEAINQAMKETMAQMEKQVHFQQGRDKEMVQSGEWIYGAFMHSTTRPVNGIAEMHTHIHAVVIHSTWNEEKQRYQSPELSRVIKDAPFYEAEFDARLAYKLKEEGYPIERRGLSFEIVGIKDELLKKFSSRTAQVEKAAKKEIAKHGRLSAKQKAQLGARSREEKEAAILSGKQLKQEWRGRMRDQEFDQILQAKQSTPLPKNIDAMQALAKAENHLFERKSVALKENDVKRLALQKSYGDVLPEQLNKAIEKAGYFSRSIKGREYVTTPKALKGEQKMLAFVRAVKGIKKPIHPTYKIDDPILNEQQRKAVYHITRGSTDRVILVSGKAGVGKTTMMKQVQKAVHDKGIKFFAFAPTSKAAHGVLKEEGFKRTNTVAQLLVNPKLQEQVKESVLWIDEASLLGNSDMNKLFEIVQKQNARLILTGDSRQHAAIKSGDAFKILQRDGGLKVVKVNSIQRQRNNPRFKQVVECAACGKIDKALHQLDKLEGVIQIADTDARMQRLVEDYSKVIKAKKSALIISPTKAEGRKVTQAIRDHWREEGLLKDERDWVRLQKLGWTEEEKRDAFSYQNSNKPLVIEFHQNAKGGFHKGERWLVVKGENERMMIQKDKQTQMIPFKQAKHFTVFEERSIRIGVGDKIRMTKNVKSKEGTKLANGMTYIVKGFNRQGEIKLHTGKHLPKSFKHLDYGIVTTSVSSQGSTVSEIFISQANQTMASSQQQFYVSISRARDMARIYTNDKKALEKAVMRDERRMTAREVANEQEWELAYRNQMSNETQIEHEYSQERGEELSL